MKRAAIEFLCRAGLAAALLTGCQTSQSGGTPDEEAGEGVEDAALVEPAEDGSGIADAEMMDVAEEGFPAPVDESEGEDAFRISVRGDDGKWEMMDEGDASDGLPSWTEPPSATRSQEVMAPVLSGGPPAPDFLRVIWEENPRKARWTARDSKRYLFFAFLSTELGNASTRFQQDLFASQAFHDLARDRVVLTYLDFPRSFGIQADEIVRERHYQRFKDYFEIHGFPSAVLLDPEGNVVCRFRGYSKRQSVSAMVAEMRDAMGAASPRVEEAAANPRIPE